jgi:uncharacterized protein (UPF0332 family)
VNIDYAKDLWSRACNAARSAEALIHVSPDDAGTRVYYAAFHAAMAAFALTDRRFDRHGAVRLAVHNEWVKAGLWTVDLGADFDAVWALRDLSDYGGRWHVTAEDATAALQAARRILQAVQELHPELAS